MTWFLFFFRSTHLWIFAAASSIRSGIIEMSGNCHSAAHVIVAAFLSFFHSFVVGLGIRITAVRCNIQNDEGLTKLTIWE